MYAATNNNRRLTFTVSGMLWNRSLVMRDVETGTLWSHILGRAMDGELTGVELEVIPSVLTTWKSWKTDHPDSSVLALNRTSKEYLGEFQKQTQRFVLGLVLRGRAMAYRFDVLQAKRVVNDVFERQPLVVTFDPDSTAAMIYKSVSGKYTLEFVALPGIRMKDRQTGSVWDSRRGLCLDGALKGTQLQALPAVISYGRVWKEFHPQSRGYSKTESK